MLKVSWSAKITICKNFSWTTWRMLSRPRKVSKGLHGIWLRSTGSIDQQWRGRQRHWLAAYGIAERGGASASTQTTRPSQIKVFLTRRQLNVVEHFLASLLRARYRKRSVQKKKTTMLSQIQAVSMETSLAPTFYPFWIIRYFWHRRKTLGSCLLF